MGSGCGSWSSWVRGWGWGLAGLNRSVFNVANHEAGRIEFGVVVFESSVRSVVGQAIRADEGVRFFHVGFEAGNVRSGADGVKVFHGCGGLGVVVGLAVNGCVSESFGDKCKVGFVAIVRTSFNVGGNAFNGSAMDQAGYGVAGGGVFGERQRKGCGCDDRKKGDFHGRGFVVAVWPMLR